VQTSTEGASLPIVYGTMRIAGNVIWSTGLTEKKKKNKTGGGSGGGGGSYTTYSYSTDCAVALCEGTITGVRRIWADTKLIYDVGSNATLETLQASAKNNIRFYTGSETQLCDPLIQAVEGTDLAYRGTAYVVFEDFQLADYGNRLPNFSFEVVKNGSSSGLIPDKHYISSKYANTSLDLADYTSQHYNSQTNTHYLTVISSSPIIGDACNLTVKFYINNPANSENILVATTSTPIYKTMLFWPSQIPYKIVPGYNVDEPCIVVTTSYSGGGENYKTISIIYMDRYINIKIYDVAGENHYRVYTNNYYIRDNFLYIVIGQNYNFNSYISVPGTLKLYKINLKTGVIININPPVIVNLWDKITNLLVSDTKIIITAQTYNGSPLSYIELDIDNLNVLKSIQLGGYSTGNMTYYFGSYNPTLSIDNKYIYWSYSNAGRWIARIDLDNFNSNTDYEVMYSVLSYHLYGHYGGYVFVSDNWLAMYGVAPYQYATDGLYVYKRKLLSMSAPTLKSVADDITTKSRLPSTSYTYTALNDQTVKGFVVSKVMSAKAALDSLQAGYNFELVEEAGKITAINKANATNKATLTNSTIGAEQI
jgi:hypothetical protein